MTACAVFLNTAVVLLTAAAQNLNFLGVDPEVVSRGRVAEQLHSTLGSGQNHESLQRLMDSLRSTYMALPQDARESLDHQGARYALHRYFLVEHGWHIEGLSPGANVRDELPTAVLKSQIPTFIMELMEERLGSDRVGLQELALMAATIEDLVHADTMALLELSYSARSHATDELLRAEEAVHVICTFLLLLLLPYIHVHVDDRLFLSMLVDGAATEYYPGWDDAVLWAMDLKTTLELQDRTALRPFAALQAPRWLDFSSVGRLATAMSSGAGRFTNTECKQLKNSMLDLEDVERDDGRVGLAKYYAPHMAGESWHFSESPAYLRHLGVLDERNPRRPRAIVPNVIYSKPNCLSTFGFYSLCCIDDCEVLMAELERHIHRPSAAPAVIAAIVSMMPSDTVAAPRNLSTQLLSRLDYLGGMHGGSVPLHSLLFQQWMHHAFPNECPSPRSMHTSEAQLTAQEWTDRTKLDSEVSQEEMEELTELMGGGQADSSEVSAESWSEDEELLSEFREIGGSAWDVASSAIRWVAGAAFLASACAMLWAAHVRPGGRLGRGGGKHGPAGKRLRPLRASSRGAAP